MALIAGSTWMGNAAPATDATAFQLPAPNAYDLYVKAEQLMVPGTPAVDPIFGAPAGNASAQQAPEYAVATRQAWLQQNAPALAMLRQGFAYSYLEPPQTSRGEGLKSMSSFRALARMLIVESHARSQQGDWHGASDSALDAMRLGHDVARGGTLISALVSYAIQAISTREMWGILPHLDGAAAHAAATRLEELRQHRVPFTETLLVEKQFGLAQLTSQMRDDNRPRDARQVVAPQSKILGTMITATLVDSYAHFLDAVIASNRQPYLRVRPVPPPGDPVTALVAPVFTTGRFSAARNDANDDMLLVALALRAYQLDHGEYPAMLSILVPAYLKVVPPDPFGGGEPLRYRVDGDTYRMWSIGPDGVDNGGQPIHNPDAGTATIRNAASLVRADSKGDMVASINR